MLPPGDKRPRPLWLRFGVSFAVWTTLGLLEFTHLVLRHAYEPGSFRGRWPLALSLSLWYAWGIVAWFTYQLVRRFPIEQRHWPRRLLLHLAACVVLVLVKLVLDYPIIKGFYCPTPDQLTFSRFYPMAIRDQFYSYVIIYWALLGILHAFNYHRNYQERELRASQLEARLTQSQLHLLKEQLHPHFLFNTLNAISALMFKDVDAADRMVARLGDLLRLTLKHHGVHEVALQQELAFIETYLEIEQVRFGPGLDVRLEVAPEALPARVPYLVLQPLVENALRHGITPRGWAGCVAIRAEAIGGRLCLQVEDSGPGLADNPDGHAGGIGLANLRARLDHLYGPGHRFELGRGQLGGLLATIDVPFVVDAASAAQEPPDLSRRLVATDAPL